MRDIAEWKQLQTTLKITKANEATARREICDEVGAGIDLSEKGRETVRTHVQGFDLKAVFTLNYSLDLDMLAQVWPQLNEADKAAVKMKPTLHEPTYKKLPDESLLHTAITTKPAAPTLEAKEPGE